MKPEKVTIRELERNDIEKLVTLLAKVYGYKKIEVDFLCDFYTWKYIKNRELYPDGTGSLVGILGEKIVGFMGALNYRLRDNEELKNAVWIADWMIDKENAPRGLGTSLLKELIDNKDNAMVTCTEVTNDGRHVLSKFNFRSAYVGVHSYCYLNARSIKNIYSKKGMLILFSILIQYINKLLSWRRHLFFAEVELKEINFGANKNDGLIVDDKYLHWITTSPSFEGRYYNILYQQKKIGYLVAQPFVRNGLRLIRILDYSISNTHSFLFLQKIKQVYKDYDIINLKHHKRMRLKSFLAGFYNSKAFFWYPDEINSELNFSTFHVSNLEKDAAFRGVNNII